MSTEKPSTLKDIAAALGVSRTLVSVCLSGQYKQGNYRVSEETAERIRRYAASIGFVPNSSARRLRQQSDPPVGLLLGQDHSESKSMPAINYALDLLADAGRETMVAGFRGVTKAVAQMKGAGVRDLIIFGSMYEGGHEESTMEQNRRLKVLLDGMRCFCVDYNFGMPEERFELDIFRFGINRTRFLEALLTAYRQAGIDGFMSVEWHPTDLLLQKGYFTAAEQIFRYIGRLHGGAASAIQLGKNMAEEFIRIRDRYHIKLIFAGDDFAGGLMRKLLPLGWKVPEDVNIIGFDNLEISECYPVPLTSFGIPLKHHMDLAINHILGKNEAPRFLISPPTVSWRESTDLPESERAWLEKTIGIQG